MNMWRILRVTFLKLIKRTLLMAVVRATFLILLMIEYFSNTGDTLIFVVQYILLNLNFCSVGVGE